VSQTVLKRFPRYALYRYIRDDRLVLTKDERGAELEVELHMQSPYFKVIDDPKIIGSTIRAMVAVWFPDTGVYVNGFATLYDNEGVLAMLIRQPHAMQKQQHHQRADQNQGDVTSVEDTPDIIWSKPQTNLGRGNFGKVWKGTVDLDDGKGARLVAVKEPIDDAEARDFLAAEMQVMEEVKGVPAIKSWAVQPVYSQLGPPMRLAMEFAPYGDLENKITRIRSHPACFWRILFQVCGVFWNMNSFNHRDIKPENIMLFPSKEGTDVNFKLGDFGLATNNGDTSFFGGTPGYLPPEAFGTPSLVTRQADVFGLGVTVLQMILGTTKPGAVDIRACKGRPKCSWQLGIRLIWQTVAPIVAEYKQTFFPSSSASGVYLDKLEDILRLMTHPDPGKRGRFSELFPVLSPLSKVVDISCPIGLVAE